MMMRHCQQEGVMGRCDVIVGVFIGWCAGGIHLLCHSMLRGALAVTQWCERRSRGFCVAAGPYFGHRGSRSVRICSTVVVWRAKISKYILDLKMEGPSNCDRQTFIHGTTDRQGRLLVGLGCRYTDRTQAVACRTKLQLYHDLRARWTYYSVLSRAECMLQSTQSKDLGYGSHVRLIPDMIQRSWIRITHVCLIPLGICLATA